MKPGARKERHENSGRPAPRFQRKQLLGLGEGEVGAEADHAEAGGGALKATEADAVFQLALEGRGHADDHEVGGGIAADGDRAEQGELNEDLAMGRGDELRDEGEKEQRGFRIQHFGSVRTPWRKAPFGGRVASTLISALRVWITRMPSQTR